MNASQATPSEIILRDARRDDVPSIAVLCGQLGYRTTYAEIEVRLPRFSRTESSWVCVAVGLDGRVIGWMQVGETDSLIDGVGAQIQALVVDERCRRTGAGRSLVNGAIAWARNRGHDKLGVRSNAARQGAHDFYPSIGFARTKTQHCYTIEIA